MAFNPLALLGGLQGFVSKNEETSNKINAMKQQGLEFQDMLRQRQRTQERENVVNAQQDAMHALNLAQAQRADEIAKLMQGYYKQAAPNEGQAIVDTSLLNAGVVKHNLNNQPRLFKLDDLDLGYREQALPLEHQFKLNDAKFNLSQQPSMQSVAAAGLANQGRELTNAWMRPMRAAWYKAQSDYTTQMAIANNQTMPFNERMKAWLNAQNAHTAGRQAIAEAASEARAQGKSPADWMQFFDVDPSTNNINYEGVFPGFGKGAPKGTLTDPSVQSLFDVLGNSAGMLFDPTTDVDVTYPSLGEGSSVINGKASLNNKNIDRYLSTSFLQNFKGLAQAIGHTGNIAPLLSEWSGVPDVKEGTHFTGTSIPPTIPSGGRLVPNPLYTALRSRLSKTPLTKEQTTHLQQLNDSFDKRLNTLAALVGSRTASEAAAAEVEKANSALTKAGYEQWSNTVRQTLASIAARVSKALEKAQLNADLISTLVPQAKTAFDNGIANSKQIAILQWAMYRKLLYAFTSYTSAEQIKAGTPMAEVSKIVDSQDWQKLFPSTVTPAISTDGGKGNAGSSGSNTEPPTMTGGAGGSGKPGSIQLRPRR